MLTGLYSAHGYILQTICTNTHLFAVTLLHYAVQGQQPARS